MRHTSFVKRSLPEGLARELRLSTLAELETREAELPVLPTGWAQLDADLAGGFPTGALTECSAPLASCGLTLLQHQLLVMARERQQFVALIDGFDRFDPGSSDPCLLESLLWVRAQNVPQAMKAADILVRDNNFGLILLDLRDALTLDLRKVPAQQWYRLQRATEEHETTLVAFTPFPTATSARLRLEFTPWGPRPREAGPLDDLSRSEHVSSLHWITRRHRTKDLQKAE